MQEGSARISRAERALASLAAAGFALLTLAPPADAAARWLDTYRAGGWFMHPILVCWVVFLAVTLERLWTASRNRENAESLRAVLEAAAGQPVEARSPRGPLARVLAHGAGRAGLGRDAVVRGLEAAAAVEIHQMERGLLWLASVASVAPLLGFLGTVSGMIHAFEDIARADQVSPRIVASGIAEALITTAAGLIVAIPAQLAYHYFLGRVERFTVAVEEGADDLLHALESPVAGARGGAR